MTAHAVGEVCGEVYEAIGAQPDLAILFVTTGHAGALEDAGAVVRSVLSPASLIGCASASVLGNGEELEGTDGIVLWAGHTGPAAVAHLQAHPGGADNFVLTGWPDQAGFAPRAGLLLVDAFSFPAEAVLSSLASDLPSMPLIGGMASSARGAGGNRLLIDDRVVSAGAALVLLGDGVEVDAIVSQASRPVGHPFTVTAAEGTTLHELGGMPAVRRIAELAERHLTPDEIAIVNGGGLHLGRATDLGKPDIGPGEFVIHGLLGGNQAEGWVVVDAPVEVGETVQFHLRDAEGADQDLRAALRGHTAETAIVATCTGRGHAFFAEANHDAAVIADALDDPPVAGFFAAGEIGPIGGMNRVQGHSTSMLLLRGLR
ncbi:MAG: FIST signal transduction protein [Acidimicrobiales bacterium]